MIFMIKKTKNKGFTLIELLAVIVIIGIVSLITVPAITKIMDSSINKVFSANEKLMITAAESYYKANSNKLPSQISNNKVVTLKTLVEDGFIKEIKKPDDSAITCKGYVVVEKSLENVFNYNSYLNCGDGFVTTGYSTYPIISLIGPSSVSVNQGIAYVDEGAMAVDDIDGDITNNIEVTSTVYPTYTGNYTVTYKVTDSDGNVSQIVRNVIVSSSTYTDYVAYRGQNKPKLITGMTPIKWNGSVWIDTTENDTLWYNYSGGYFQWANARTADGSIWVWIPRYAYQIARNYHTTSKGVIYIKFLKDNTNIAGDNTVAYETPTYNAGSQTNYIAHPAFTFGTTELTGIWVAKFEASVSDTSNVCYTSESAANCNITTLIPKIVPNVRSWRYVSIDNMFTVSRSMETNNVYGWGTSGTGLDTHLMKNTEWGAVTYLAQSTSGRWYGEEIWINPANDYTTGCAGDSYASSATTGCLRAYNTYNGKSASTTSGSDPYGIYDMSGGSYEYTAAYVNNGDSTLTTYGNNIINADLKYKDVYIRTATDDQKNNYNNNKNKKGDAVYETSSSYIGVSAWNNDSSEMPLTGNPFFIRGGSNSGGYAAGTYNFDKKSGDASVDIGFRPVLVIGDGL
jgi:prepilin-type N-terminal cleavage/methylation domain-containing protein